MIDAALLPRVRLSRGLLLAALAILAALAVAGLGPAGGSDAPHTTADHTAVLHRGNEPSVIPRARPRPATAGISRTLLAAPPGAMDATSASPSVIVHDHQTVSGASIASALPPARAPPG